MSLVEDSLFDSVLAGRSPTGDRRFARHIQEPRSACSTPELRWLESLVVQVQSVQNLVVIVPRGRVRLVGEQLRVGSFEQKNRRVVRCEFRMNSRIVKRVVLMAEYLHTRTPWASRLVGLGIPQFTERGRFSEPLHENCHPSLPPRIPGNRAGVKPYL